MPRPDQLILVTGTGTEIGKTWVTARLAVLLGKQGVRVSARKPAQSFGTDEGPTDAEVLATAVVESPERVCPRHRWYEVPMAPPMAADFLGRPAIAVADLAREVHFPAGVAVGFVETAGGVRSPLAHDGDAVDLARLLAPDVVLLVADAGLGTLNAVLLSTAALDGWPTHVFLNRFDRTDPLHEANRAWLADRFGLQVSTAVDELAEALRPRPLGSRSDV